ncbi:MAG: hypothetical protein JWN87_90 [Frankiales bacterium]|jgi:hypothetical protein|nr:hypothetical protein [Frankiales bacterium]MCW2586008.1 hypothetical protein [Frankiales bacterium]
MTPDEPPLGAPDTYALRRRVLLTGVVAVGLWLATSYLVYWLGVSDAWVLVALVLIYFLVIRPLLRPVRDAVKLRRRLAYQAYLDERGREEQ